MKDQTQETNQNNTSWMRVLFVALFWVILHFTNIVVLAVVVGQCLFKLFTGSPNAQLMRFGDRLTRYVTEILRYATFNSDERPFPFKDFPESDLAIASDTQ